MIRGLPGGLTHITFLFWPFTHGGPLPHTTQILRSALTYQGPEPKGSASAALGGCSRTVSDSAQVVVEEIFSVVVPLIGTGTPPLVQQAATAAAKTARMQIRINEDLGGWILGKFIFTLDAVLPIYHCTNLAP